MEPGAVPALERVASAFEVLGSITTSAAPWPIGVTAELEEALHQAKAES